MPSLLQMQGITKRYPGVLALDGVDFSLSAGEVNCLVGENGAGKSTLMKVLSGATPMDAGTITVGGEEAHLSSPGDAQRLGIGVIYQDFKLVPYLSVAENILLGSEPVVGRTPIIDRRRMHLAAAEALQMLEEELPTDALIDTLSVAQRQVVEIAKALSRNVRILAMDEPTAPLTERETENLFGVIRTLKERGVGIIFISHRLEEIFEVGDRVTVLRDGKLVHTGSVSEIDRRGLIRHMVGRELENEFPRGEFQPGEEILRIEHLSSAKVSDVSLALHRGEVLGLAGLVGAGRTELARLLFGADRRTGGRIVLEGKEIAPASPHEAIEAGIGLLTEDRNKYGLIMQMSVRENISLASLSALLRGPFIDRAREEAVAKRFTDDLRIKLPHVGVNVETLSGGNRQKVVLARWLNTKAKVLVFDEPTAGIDVGVKYEIYTLINRLVADGIGVIVISSDLPELLGICTRIAVMCEGRLTATLDARDATQEAIMTFATHRQQR
ncbi:MAG: sugar ABC transporter ATP-binding protein [Bacteroidota bacterium]